MLSTHVKSIGDLMSIALRAEREAIRRYTQLAADMRQGDNASVADLFERMVHEEQEHERLLLQWMAQENITENPLIGPISWRDPQVSTTYNDEACDPYSSTPYRALAFAGHNEEIAFRFYTHVAANSDNETIRKYAEILAREELGHAALIRAERRRAYHVERQTDNIKPGLDAGAVHNQADLLTAAAYIDRRLLTLMNLITAAIPEIVSLATETQSQITRNEEALRGLTAPGKDIIGNIEQLELYDLRADKTSNDTDQIIQRLCTLSDRSFAFYDTIVVNTTDESIMFMAQSLTSSALDRIDALKHLLESSTATCD